MKGLPIVRCRPRVEGERESQILAATTAELIVHGYDKLTLDAVAAAAHVSKATLYRRWTGKADLVLDAIAHVKNCAPLSHVDTGSLRGDLLELGCGLGGLTDPQPLAVLSAVASAMHRDSDLFAEFSARVVEPARLASVRAFEAAVARAEIPPGTDIDTLSQVLPALAMYQVFLLGRPLSRDRIAYLVDTVVLPACGVPTGPPPRPERSRAPEPAPA